MRLGYIIPRFLPAYNGVVLFIKSTTFTSPTALASPLFLLVTSRNAREEDILDGVPWGFTQYIISASHQSIFFTKHFTIFADESQAVYVWINTTNPLFFNY
jgi:hypothetical protein